MTATLFRRAARMLGWKRRARPRADRVAIDRSSPFSEEEFGVMESADLVVFVGEPLICGNCAESLNLAEAALSGRVFRAWRYECRTKFPLPQNLCPQSLLSKHRAYDMGLTGKLGKYLLEMEGRVVNTVKMSLDGMERWFAQFKEVRP